jgi:hypothetical protein
MISGEIKLLGAAAHPGPWWIRQLISHHVCVTVHHVHTCMVNESDACKLAVLHPSRWEPTDEYNSSLWIRCLQPGGDLDHRHLQAAGKKESSREEFLSPKSYSCRMLLRAGITRPCKWAVR